MATLYSYNGVKLPELPTQGGHQLIWRGPAGYFLEISSTPWYFEKDENLIATSFDGQITKYGCPPDSTEWYLQPPTTPNEGSSWLAVLPEAFIWSNSDIKTADIYEAGELVRIGGVALEGTEPVPCGADGWVTILCAGSMMQGSSQVISCTIDGTRRVPFNCTLSGKTSGSTTLTKLTDYFYQLKCGIDEKASGLTLRATSIHSEDSVATKIIRIYAFSSDPDNPGSPVNPDSPDNPDPGYPDNPEDFVYAEEPTILSCGEHATYNVGDIAEPLVCEASVSDGGTLTYAWYCNDTLVSETDTCIPSTEVEASDFYYCEVTNTLGGSTATMISDYVSIEVLPGSDTPSDTLPDAGSFIQGWLMGRMIRLRGFPKKEETT